MITILEIDVPVSLASDTWKRLRCVHRSYCDELCLHEESVFGGFVAYAAYLLVWFLVSVLPRLQERVTRCDSGLHFRSCIVPASKPNNKWQSLPDLCGVTSSCLVYMIFSHLTIILRYPSTSLLPPEICWIGRWQSRPPLLNLT